MSNIAPEKLASTGKIRFSIFRHVIVSWILFLRALRYLSSIEMLVGMMLALRPKRNHGQVGMENTLDQLQSSTCWCLFMFSLSAGTLTCTSHLMFVFFCGVGDGTQGLVQALPLSCTLVHVILFIEEGPSTVAGRYWAGSFCPVLAAHCSGITSSLWPPCHFKVVYSSHEKQNPNQYPRTVTRKGSKNLSQVYGRGNQMFYCFIFLFKCMNSSRIICSNCLSVSNIGHLYIGQLHTVIIHPN